jgi:hypothetical protein
MKCPNPQCSNEAVQATDRFCSVCDEPILPEAPSQEPDAVVDIDHLTALRGGSVSVMVTLEDEPRRMKVKIPSHTPDGAILRLSRSNGGELRILVQYQRSSRWTLDRDGARKGDLYSVLPVSPDQAENGASLEVPVIEGKVRVTVPARSTPKTRLRLGGLGMPSLAGTTQRGDLYFNLIISEAAAQLVVKWGEPALELIADHGATAAEQCLEHDWSPAEWWEHHLPVSVGMDEAFDTLFMPKGA